MNSKYYALGFQDGQTTGRECQESGCYSYDLAGLEPWDAWLINSVGLRRTQELMDCEEHSEHWESRLREYSTGAMAGYVVVGE